MSDITTNPGAALRTGEVEIVEILLYPRHGGEAVEVSLHMVEINIFTNLFDSFLTATLTLMDNIGLMDQLPITGEETVVITLRSGPNQTQDTVSKVFKAYSIGDLSVTGEYNKIFTLYMISVPGYVNNLIHLKKRFHGKGSDMIASIVEDYIKEPSLDITRQYDKSPEQDAVNMLNFAFNDLLELAIPANETLNNVDFVAANWTPAYTINWILSKSIGQSYNGQNESPTLLFTEGFRFFVFDPLEKLYHRGRSDADPQSDDFRLTYLPVGHTKDTTTHYNSIIDYDIIRISDTLRSSMVGGFASSMQTYDIVTKRYHKQNLDWITLSKEYTRLEDYSTDDTGRQISTFGNPRGLTSDQIPRSYDNKIYSVIKQNQLFDGLPSYLPERITQIRNFHFNSLDNINMNVTVNGRFDYEPGRVVHLTFPMNKMNEDGRVSEYISGYYIVTAVRHKITHRDHFTYLEVAKESSQMQEFV